MHMFEVYYEPVENQTNADLPEVREHLVSIPAFISAHAREEASLEYDLHEDDLTVELGRYLG